MGRARGVEGDRLAARAGVGRRRGRGQRGLETADLEVRAGEPGDGDREYDEDEPGEKLKIDEDMLQGVDDGVAPTQDELFVLEFKSLPSLKGLLDFAAEGGGDG